ncbi:hypothetical protein LOCC1_G007564 [Lachnellula occidentalis]|uniref:Rrn9 domain-containing protein n=1 Tax=Lachnellula occidentalis TaxID=215460 RepID=A0A8H8RKF5_9HELO|nr:hypothetical protein LOCC1_G007564 [Lachnellula occidentalis]
MSDHSNSSDPEEPDLSRPNRWTGAPSTWQDLTAQERGLAASLDALRDRDLSVHLYNAHALKKRAAFGVRQEDEDAAEPFVPPKTWTAWPLPPDNVPREGEPIGGEDDSDEVYTLRRREKARASGELEDVLLGISLKSAKERFEGREWASEEEKDVDDEDEDGLVAPPEEDNGGEHGDPIIKEQTPEKTFLRPVVSADDERSREILRPTIRHTLSKLDDVLMALHHARKTCRRYSSVSAPNTGDEESSGEEDEEDSAKRPVGRPKKFENLTDRSRPEEVDQDDNLSAEMLRAKKPGRGRKPKQYPRHAEETDHQYLIRIARLQKKPIPKFSSEETGAPSIVAKPPKKAPVPKLSAAPKSPARSPSSRNDRIPPKETDRRVQRNLGLRDWSEVLGSAALVGFSPDVIARATQRCANLFGESMTMRTMIEAPFGNENPDTLTTYQPEAIPDFESSLSESDSSDNSEESGREHHFVKQTKPRGNAPKKEVCFCPIKDCPRQVRGFSSMQDMRAHLKRGHHMSNEDIAEFEVPSDEEMDGAVHVDGFLKVEKRTLRGRDRGKRKRRRGQSGAGNRNDEDEEGSTSEEPGSNKAGDGQAIVREDGGNTGSDNEDS